MFFLHIGIHKTGSSSIQRFLARNLERLENAGYGLFVAGKKTSGHVGRLGREITDGKTMQTGKVMPRFVRFLAKTPCEHQIASSERLEGLAQPEAALLRQLIGDRPIRLIVYLRRQEDAIESAYLEHLKRGYSSSSFDEWFGEFVETPRRNRDFLRFDYEALLRRWKAAGFDDVQVRRYERSQLKNGDVIDDFLQAIGMPDAVSSCFERIAALNLSLSARHAPLVRDLLRAHPALSRVENYRRLKPLTDALIATMPAERRSLLSEAQLYRCEELFAESNARVARDWFGEPTLFPAVSRPPMMDASPLRHEEVVQIVDLLLDVIGRQVRGGREPSEEDDDET